MFPLQRGITDRRICDVFAIGRIAGLEAPRDGELCGHASFEIYCEKLLMAIAVNIAVGREKNFAIRSEAAHRIGSRMPGQTSRRSARDRNGVDIGVAVILSAESNYLTVRRKDRVGF